MFADTRPAELDPLDGANAWSEFRVGNPRERLALLRQLRDAGATIVVTGPDGSSLNTTLWSVDDAVLALAVDTGAAALQKLLDHDDALAVAYIEAVKLQFDLRGLVLVRGTHASVLQCATPSEIYRFQRRQHYRVRTDESQGPVACLPHPMRPGAQMLLRVLDVSGGGCALWLPEAQPLLLPGSELPGTAITLDAETHFEATLLLQHLSVLGGRRPGRGVRVGCGWRLEPAAERSLQRWIDRAQKRRRLFVLD
ncbi:MAG: flagellar brake protein [Pseudomonadota bacterium]|jgi:c-di-GMP-binding flagellar brake protein YcgR|nr:flagellar brake protein [Rubrivivax sp.]MCA3257502.1 flagellar brake protein [Rubrivivax sp.]MCZ8029878.1 flagellar brake protein [Rubrivivax sp.]